MHCRATADRPRTIRETFMARMNTRLCEVGQKLYSTEWLHLFEARMLTDCTHTLNHSLCAAMMST